MKRFDRNAFSWPSANLDLHRKLDFHVGNAFFERVWDSAPASTQAADGLGPLYNARSCQRCHINDGRGHPPAGPGDDATSLILHLSVPPGSPEERRRVTGHRYKFLPEPTYGSQLQEFAIQGPRLSVPHRMRMD